MEQSRRHGHWDPRYAPKPALLQEGRVSLVTPRNTQTKLAEQSASSGGARVAFRHELCDAHGSYVGTFVTENEPWQVGDAFTTGDGRALRITEILAPERSSRLPAFTDRWNVEPTEKVAASAESDGKLGVENAGLPA